MIGRIFYIGLNKLTKDLCTRFIIIVQLVLLLYLLNLTLGISRYDNYILKMVENMNVDQSYYCSDNFKAFDNIRIGEIRQCFGTIKNKTDSTLSIKAYNDEIINNMPITLSKGFWFTKYKGEEEPIILSYTYAKKHSIGINDIVQLEMNKSHTLIDDSNRYRVIGILNKANYHLSFTVEGNYLMWKNIIKPDDSVALISSNTIGEPQNGRMLFLNKDANSEEVLAKLKDLSLFSSSEQLTENTEETLSEKIRVQSIFWLLILALTITSLVSNNMLEKIYEEKEFAAYYMLGLDWSKCILIEVFRGITQVTISFVIAFILLEVTQGKNNYETIIIGGYNYIVSIGVIFTIYIASSLWMIIELLKTNPIELIRRNE